MKSFKQYITELFDKPADWYVSREDSGLMHYESMVNDKELDIQFTKEDEDEWDMSFAVDGEETVTGTGDEVTIFSTVLDVMADFVSRVDTKYITFDAEKGGKVGNSRVKLYDRLVKKFASSHGYKLVNKKEGSLGGSEYNTYILEKE